MTQVKCEQNDIPFKPIIIVLIHLTMVKKEAQGGLQETGIIEADLAKVLMNMVGFRNIAVNDYQTLDLDILETILENHINDFKVFTRVVLQVEK